MNEPAAGDHARDVGFVGLGNMGAAMAERLCGPAWRLHVFDPRPEAVAPLVERGAVRQASPAAVAEAAPIVLACLPSPAVSLAVATGPGGIVEGSAVRIYVEMSTIGGETVERLAATLASRNIAMADAPVTGGPPVARSGNLAIMVAGEDAVVDQLRPVLEAIGRHVIRIGEHAGMAQRMKLINNSIMAANMVAACEGLAMGVKAGLDVDTMLSVLRVGTGQSFAGCELLRYAVSGAFDMGAKLSIVAKDVTLGQAEAATLGAVTDVIARAAAAWTEAGETALGEEDCTAIMKAVEQRNGIVVRSGAARRS